MSISKNKKTIITTSARATQRLGEALARTLSPGDIVCLVGPLGAGKTCLVKGFASGLAVKGYVNSPTFKLINEYQGKWPVYHFDLYRLAGSRQVSELGYEEYLFGRGVTLIEWAEKILPLLPRNYLRINMKRIDEHTRKIELRDWRTKQK
jgi:tRNA threonylcarbamoyladenosine biosynthesis protein TsaE